MCGFVTISKILRGLDGIKFFSVLITLLTTIICNTRETGSSTASIAEKGRLLEMRGNLEASGNRLEIFNNEDFMLGHSGDAWGSRNESKEFRDPRIRLQSFTLNNTISRNSTGRNTIHRRSRRSVIHLYNAILCGTGCDPLAYKGYGCFCGFLGSGIPVDGIDRCCSQHDRCYGRSPCTSWSMYTQPYYWKCFLGYKPICAAHHGKFGGRGSCAHALCLCDIAFASCLKRFPCPTTKAICVRSPWRLVQNIFMIF